jgi:hypothetical protein
MTTRPEIALISWDETFTTLKLNYRITNSLTIAEIDFYFRVEDTSVSIEIAQPLKEKIIFRIEDLYGRLISKSRKVIRKGEMLTLSIMKEVKGKWGFLNSQYFKPEVEQDRSIHSDRQNSQLQKSGRDQQEFYDPNEDLSANLS